ncbi:MAG: DEAD/DEAH box helicase family protein [Minwuia sp.]|nr:DEAD/DEAH box helicase family protein [Minwuia sp.]
MSQFTFLRDDFPALFDFAEKAEHMALSDARSSCFYARLTLEAAVDWLYRADATLKSPYQETLAARIHEATFRQLVGTALVTKAQIIKDHGNRAVHDKRPVAKKAAVTTLRELFHLLYWLARTYSKDATPAAGLQFDPARLEATINVTASTVEQIRKLREEHDRHLADLAVERKTRLSVEDERLKLEASVQALQAEIAAVKKANQAVPDNHDYDEATTRDAFIDLLLHEAGWPLDQEQDIEYPVVGMPSTSGDGFVDYVLWGDDGKPLALVEAKRSRKDAMVGQQQAKLYADCLETMHGRRPVIYCTNGYQHWLWDDRMYPPRAVSGFMKKSELVLLHQRRTTRRKLDTVPVDEAIAGRYYQTRAIRRVGQTFETDRQRRALLVMATGSGKTRTVVGLIDQLMRGNWVRRVLFLADRIALVRQAHGAFKTHLPSSPSANLLERHDASKNDHNGARVLLSTYPTMMRMIDDLNGAERRFGAGHFDLVVIDEAHRSVYRKYRAIFDYFDCLLIGLTATPRDESDHDTYALFQLQTGVPTDYYELDQAVSDGFLVPPEAISVPLKFQRDGIRYDDLSDEEKERWDALDWSDGDDSPDAVSASDVNKWLFNTDTVDKVLEHLMTNGVKVQEGSRLGKTIIFAKNSRHARFIAERFDINYPHLKGQFARVIDYSVDYAQSLIDDFSDAGKAPHIAISVDMLDTGIDIPEVVNLVFFKIVRSRTKFWQMIGRGTRLSPDLFGPGEHKDRFRVFDFCQNFEFFSQNPTLVDGSNGASIDEKLFCARIDLMGTIDGIVDEIVPPSGSSAAPGLNEGANQAPFVAQPGLEALRESLEQRLFEEVSAMNLDNFIVRNRRREVERFQVRANWQDLNAEDQETLKDHVAGLPSAFTDDDLQARQFDYLVLLAQLALLKGGTTFPRYQERMQTIASALEDLGAIPMVAAQMTLILDILTPDWWQDVTASMLEEVRQKLRGLVRLIEPASRKIVYTDFQDEIGAGVTFDLPDVSVNADLGRFREKVRQFLKEHEDHIVLQKLRRNEQLTPQDIEELERMFLEAGIAGSEDLKRLQSEGGLGIFLRSLVGLDREAAKAVLGTFVADKSLNANQIEFVNMIIDHLTDQGIMEPSMLYESPFTDFDDQGVSGLFPMADIHELISLLKDIRQHAIAS